MARSPATFNTSKRERRDQSKCHHLQCLWKQPDDIVVCACVLLGFPVCSSSTVCLLASLAFCFLMMRVEHHSEVQLSALVNELRDLVAQSSLIADRDILSFQHLFRVQRSQI